VRSEVKLGYLSRWQALTAFGWILRYQLGFASIEEGLRRSIATLAGTREEELHRRTLDFFAAHIRGHYRPGALDTVASHRRAGDQVVLLTSSSSYLSHAVSEDIGLDGYLCNRFGVDQHGIFTGEPVEPLCFEQGKVIYAEEYARRRGVRLADCTYYADSTSDLPMFAAVGTAVAVNPDPRLARVARHKVWSIVDWGRPAGQPKR
jgi:HAD superfamily hydrolase (TIGR01490 family)